MSIINYLLLELVHRNMFGCKLDLRKKIIFNLYFINKPKCTFISAPQTCKHFHQILHKHRYNIRTKYKKDKKTWELNQNLELLFSLLALACISQRKRSGCTLIISQVVIQEAVKNNQKGSPV